MKFSVGKKILAAMLCMTVLSFIPMTVNAAYISQYNNKKGLNTSRVNDACQTTDGYIWIAQYEGLTRLDGSRFDYINVVEADGNTVNLEQITNVEGDEQNNLYIGTQYGVICYTNGEYHKLNDETALSVEDINIYKSENGETIVYVGTANGAFTYRDGVIKWIEDSIGNDVI